MLVYPKICEIERTLDITNKFPQSLGTSLNRDSTVLEFHTQTDLQKYQLKKNGVMISRTKNLSNCFLFSIVKFVIALHVHLVFASSSTATMQSTYIVSLFIISSRELFGLILLPPSSQNKFLVRVTHCY